MRILLLCWWLLPLHVLLLGNHEVHGFARISRNQFLHCLQQQTTTKFAPGVGSLRGGSRGQRQFQNAAAPLSSSSSSSLSLNRDVEELLELIQGGSGRSYSKKTTEERQQILALMEKLEAQGASSRYLDDEAYIGSDDNVEEVGGSLLWDSYELAYFDRSIDGDRGSGSQNKQNITKDVDPYKNATRPFGIRSKLLGSLFGLRYSFQHVCRPGRAINDVGFKVLGLPASVIAGGNFTRVSQQDVESIQKETGTQLRSDTAVRIDFESPVLWLGHKRWFPLIFNLGSKAQSPPVTLCTTYMDNRIRLALAAKGGRLIFTRGGKTTKEFAQDWQTIEGKRPNGGRVVGTLFAAAAAAAWRRFPSARASLKVAAAIPATLVLLSKVFGGGGSNSNNISGANDDGGDTWIKNTKNDIASPTEATATVTKSIKDTVIEPDETRDAWIDMVSDIIAEDEEDEAAAEGATKDPTQVETTNE